eukprot:1594078-Prymnesium_polylepis.1
MCASGRAAPPAPDDATASESYSCSPPSGARSERRSPACSASSSARRLRSALLRCTVPLTVRGSVPRGSTSTCSASTCEYCGCCSLAARRPASSASTVLASSSPPTASPPQPAASSTTIIGRAIPLPTTHTPSSAPAHAPSIACSVGSGLDISPDVCTSRSSARQA